MSNWLEKFKKQLKLDKEAFPENTKVPPYFSTENLLGAGMYDTSKWVYNTTSSAVTVTAPTPNTTFTSTINIGQAGMASTMTIPNYTMGTYASIQQQQPTSIIRFMTDNGTEIVRMDVDGTVVWANGIELDEAAKCFAKSMRMGAEISAGITKKVKLEMRDSVFNDIISIAKEKGSLTAEDLTFLLEASKIIEKLKGGRE